MNMTRLIKVLPMLVMVASLAYAAYSIQPVVSSLSPAAGAAKAGKQAVVEGAGQAVTAASSPEASPAVRVAGRNPFQVVAKPDRIEDGKNSTPELEKTDSPLATLEGLTLNATFLQGRTQMAIIDGRIYEPGQNLVGANDEPSPLIVTQVFMNKVIFQADGKRYYLAYPDQLAPPTASTEDELAAPGQGELPPGLGSQDLGSQLALIRALLSSPNGGLGAGLIGAAGGGNPLADNAPRTKALGGGRGTRSPVKGSRARTKVKARPRPSPTAVQ
jgi:hypothetical protein